MDYKNAGVDIEAGYKAVELMKKHVASTMRSEVHFPWTVLRGWSIRLWFPVQTE